MKSLFFWGMAAILTSSAYKDLMKISSPGNAAVTTDAQGSKTGGGSPSDENTQSSASENGDMQNAAAEPGSSAGDILAEQADGVQKKVALTFDDGPHSVYTKQLLDGLAERNVHVSFFVIGKNIPGNEDLIARMHKEGHLIGNHTYDHVKICDLSGEEACEQVEKTSELVREITGEDTEFVRPPFGAWNKSMECSFRMIPVLWDVDPLDWTTKNKALIEERVLENVSSGDIILLHDYYESSVEAALDLVDELQAQGYEFVTVDELILE